MPVYIYRGRNIQTNENVTGERFSSSSQALAAVLRREQIAPTNIREKKESKLSFSFRNEDLLTSRVFAHKMNHYS